MWSGSGVEIGCSKWREQHREGHGADEIDDWLAYNRVWWWDEIAPQLSWYLASKQTREHWVLQLTSRYSLMCNKGICTSQGTKHYPFWLIKGIVLKIWVTDWKAEGGR